MMRVALLLLAAPAALAFASTPEEVEPYPNIADAPYATATGRNTHASGLASTAIGDFTKASGEASTAMGRMSEAMGVGATAMGKSSEATVCCGTHGRAVYYATIYMRSFFVAQPRSGDGSASVPGSRGAVGAVGPRYRPLNYVQTSRAALVR